MTIYFVDFLKRELISRSKWLLLEAERQEALERQRIIASLLRGGAV